LRLNSRNVVIGISISPCAAWCAKRGASGMP
jgi:hypothetical protein